MTRYLFAGTIEDLTVAADASLGGALKAAPGATLPALYDGPKWDGGRATTNDFLVVDLATGATSAVSSITVGANGYPPPFYGPDGVAVLYTLEGIAWIGRLDGVDLSIPAATESTSGIAKIATSGLVTAGANNTDFVTPLKLQEKMDAHDADGTAHQDIRDAISDNFTALLSKADLSSGVVPDSQISSSTAADPDSLARRTATGALVVGNGSADDEAVNVLQMETAINDSASLGADVRQKSATSLPLSIPTPAGTFVAVPGLTITDAASDQIWQVDYTLHYRALSAAGIQVQFKTNTSAPTNKLANPSFETNTTNWTPTAATALARASAVAAQDGTFYMTMTAATAANSIATSEWVPATVGSIWSAGAYWRWQNGTPRVCRTDIQFGDAAQVAIPGAGTALGAGVTPGTGAWSQSKCEDTVNGIVAPSGTNWVRVRLAVTGPPAVGDIARVDAVQLEPVKTLPAFGSTGGGGTTALEINGSWEGITTGGGNANFSNIQPVRTPTVAGTVGQFGGVDMSTDSIIKGSFEVAVVGTGLTNQIIQLEMSQRVSNATAASLVAGRATFARTT